MADQVKMAVPAGEARLGARRRYAVIDWLRGIAVVLMIQTHLFDAWMQDGIKKAYDRRDFHLTFGDYWRITGGIPARLFLLLVGVSLALRFETMLTRGESRGPVVRSSVRRGIEILVLAYLFRLQEYILGGGGPNWPDLFRVDVLNCIGFTMVLVALLVTPWSGRRQIGLSLLLAGFFLALGPELGTYSYPGWIPRPITSYFGGERPMSWFPIFSWAAWPFLGVAIGHLWVWAARHPRREAITYLACGVAGAASLLTVKWIWRFGHGIKYATPVAQDLGPEAFFYRMGLIGMLAAIAWIACRLTGSRFSMMQQLGQTSLLIYWIHIDLCYGRWFWMYKGKLGIGGALIGFALMTMVMLGVSIAKTRWFQPWWNQVRRRKKPSLSPAPVKVPR